MTLPDPVAASWSAFADAVDVAAVGEGDYNRFAQFAVHAFTNGVGLDALQDSLIDLASRDGAPDFLAGELTTGLDVALRALSQHVNGAGALAAAAEKSAAEVARTAALGKLSDDERKALGLS